LYVAAGVLLALTGPPAAWAAVLALPYAVSILPWWSVREADAESANRGWKRFLWLNYATGALVTMLIIATVTFGL